MSRVRVLVGTRKGAFVITSDGTRTDWSIRGPEFGGWEILHAKGSPADPDRLYLAQWTDWFGQVIQRSDDGGKTWNAVGKHFAYEGAVGTHLWYDGTPHPWEFKRVWHLEPSAADADTVYAGVRGRGPVPLDRRRRELAGAGRPAAVTARAGTGSRGRAACACTRSCLDPAGGGQILTATSAVGVFRSDDHGQTWTPANRGLRSEGMIADPEAAVGHCVHRIARHPARPRVLFNAEALGRHAQRRRRRLVARDQRRPPVRLRLPHRGPRARARHGVRRPHQERLGALSPRRPAARLPQPDRGRRVGGPRRRPAAAALLRQRPARTRWPVDALDPCGVYFGTTGGQVYVSPDAGDHWTPIARDLPAVLSVEVQTLP